ATGTFSYVIPVSGCGATVNATGTITVTPSISAGAASSSPIAAINIAMANVTHTTTGATGIGTATGLPAGVTAAWASNTITISGTPTTLGTFAYTIPLVGSCGSANATGTITVVNCGAFVAAGVYKAFMCHNLGATNTSLDPNVPVQAIHGNYYQWGRSAVVATASTPAGAIGGWYTSNVPDNSWGTASGDNFKNPTNDPCPTGFRVPTKTEWDGVINASLNTVSRTGSWTNDGNFTTAIHYGPSVTVKTLTLPAAGSRNLFDGTLTSRGTNGYYWSSNEFGPEASHLLFSSSVAITTGNPRTFGYSVRCVSE
ncbi:MAG: FISUMP domain-containing protein, partial [Microcystis sp. LE19-251.1A]|nr:FISUMP domain-containing protein [Microcystis sp. LE19-251.1A]